MNDEIEINPVDNQSFSATGAALEKYIFNGNFAVLLVSLITAMIWILYITYYNSRVIGYIITRLITKFYVRKGFLKIGSFTICALSGKIMFRDIVYITHDYSIRIQDGWIIFRWWLSYVPKDVSEDLSHSDTRLSVMLNGFELHFYNRCELYSKLERIFWLEPSIIPWDELTRNNDVEAQLHDSGGIQQVSIGKSWRDLIPVIKVDISSGRFVFGNRLIPTTLSVNVEEAHCVYSTKPAASKLDHFMHFVKCKAENFKVILAPSPKYTGIADEPPRFMGAGFVVFSSNKIEMYYYMDEPGVVPEEPEMLQLANGDIVESAPPIWGIDIKCGKGTDFSFGPWADRQREHLFKFFFPQDYQDLIVTKPSLPGEKRQVQSFDIRLSTLYESTIDILFTKNKETNAIHVNVGPGSYLEITMPWIVNKDGYITKITGQLLHLEATTSLQFRSLVESETLEFSVRCHYPLRWNDHQEWLLNLTGCKATGWFVYAHKDFFDDLINDWASKSKPDLLHFIPYTWKLTVLLKEFELLTLSNEYNWIDCSSQNQENAHIAICGDLFDFSFDLPFDDFLPRTLPLRFWIQGESVDLAIYLPEVYTSRNILLSLDKNAKLLSRDGSILHPRPQDNSRKWRNICKRNNGWIDFWSIPIAALSINYTFHPMPPFGPPPQADITTPEKEEILLSPIRMSNSRKTPPVLHWSKDGGQKFDPSILTPDKVNLELEIGPSVMFLYGTCLRHLVHLKESIFGEDQVFTDMNDPPSKTKSHSTSSVTTAAADGNSVSDDDQSKKEFDPRYYRPLDVVVSITMHDIQAHLMKSCMEKDPPCPIILLERFGFEMKIEYKEMQLQLLLSPAILISTDKLANRPSKDTHLSQGHMMLSGLQLRGHGVFSDRGRTLEQKTLEYAWMLEIQIGKLSGKLTSPQMFHIVTGLETLIFLMFDDENKLRLPRLPQECLHGLPPKICPESDSDGTYRCPSSNDVKYRMTRCSIDAVDLYLVESGTAINIWASPIRIATCNLHGNHIKNGVTTLIPAIRLKHMVAANSQVCNHHGIGTASNSNTNTTCSGKSQHRTIASDGNDIWLEVGTISLGPLILEAAVSLSCTDKNLHLVQHKFLKYHDERYKKLWFLWPCDSKLLVTGRCGCIGGCIFFGRNRNGQRFFKPTRQDVQDGVNIVAFRINESGKDPGFGQSILHEGQLVFRTPPYNTSDLTIHDIPPPVWSDTRIFSSTSVRSKINDSDNHILPENMVASMSSVTDSPSTTASSLTPAHNQQAEEKISLPRRFSSTSINYRFPSISHALEVPYARLIDSSPTSAFPPMKLDSDSRLNTLGSILSVPENNECDGTPKSSISDSKLSVDYFNTNSVIPNSNWKETERNTAGSDSVTSLSVGENKLVSSGDETMALFKRTVSLSSENQSETFFSAEEELSQNRNSLDSNALESKSPTSRGSSLRNSVVSSSGSYIHEVPLPRKHFGSDINILPENKKSTVEHLDEIKVNITAYRSDHEIHTPDHRNGYFGKPYFEQGRVVEDEKSLIGSLEYLQRQLIETPSSWPSCVNSLKVKNCSLDDDDTLIQNSSSALLLDSSDSHSVSSTSFISAVSSQEDLTLVNLHVQVNKPIVDSPLLMSTYVNYLSQVGCSNWNQASLPPGSDVFTVPFFQKSNDGRLAFIGSKYLPRFDMLREGFTSLKMVTRLNSESSPAPSFGRPSENTYPWDRNQPDFITNINEDFECVSQEEFLSLRNDSGTRTTIIIKMKGDVDIMVTPLIFESLQRFVDALTPTLSILHPITVLNHLHMSCIGKVQSVNVLKKDKYLSQLQGGGSKRSTAERVKNLPKNSSGFHEPYSVFEEFIASQIQGTLILPKINVSILQASIVEEVISFSALDNLRDLTCVSLLAICVDDVTAHFHFGKQAREVVQSFHRPSVTPSGQKKGVLSRAANKALLLGLHFTSAPGKDNARGEPVYIETSEKQERETVVTFNINKIHTQLRRLRNESSLLKDAVITAIPSYSSKVLFTTCSKSSCSPSNTMLDSLSVDKDHNLCGSPNELMTLTEEKMGFIMMECGFERVSFKLVKRSKFEKNENPPNADVKENATDININKNSVVPTSEGLSADLSKYNVDYESNKIADGNNDACGSTNNPAEVEIDSQKDQTKSTGSLPEKHDNSGNSTMNKILDDNASSCIIEIEQVWFNFAAPPRTPITRKIDYTRLDWNLLSTASPAINAWMNPSNRFAIRVVHMLRCSYRRNTAIITCLMAEALDIQSLHVPVKSRYGLITPMAKTLHEDPSCQLCNILKKYLLLNSNVEQYLKDDVPHLSILRQGVIVLSRQWKNILYTPMLLEHNFKCKKPMLKPLNVTFAVPDPEVEKSVLTDEGDGDGEGDGEADASYEECEVTDECAMLLSPAVGITPNTLRKVLKTPSHKYAPVSSTCPKVHVSNTATVTNPASVSNNITTSVFTNTDAPAIVDNSSGSSIQPNQGKPGVPPRKKRKSLLPTQQPSSSRASVIFPIGTAAPTYSPQHQCSSNLDKTRKLEMTAGVTQACGLDFGDSANSLSSAVAGDNLQNSATSLEGPNLSLPTTYFNSTKLIKSGHGEDLYTWMAKQELDDTTTKTTESKVAKSTFWVRHDEPPKEEIPVVNPAFVSNPDYTLLAAAGFSLYPMHDSLRLLDAHLIFEPLLSSLGVMPQQMITNTGAGNSSVVTSLDSWGSNLTLVGGIETMRIDIVVSESGRGVFDDDSNKKLRAPKQQNKSKLHEKQSLEITSEIPAFLCERVNLECDVRRMADMAIVNDLSRQRRNMLYVSRGQLKKHSNTALNVSVSAHHISQQVNMPLLRLLHQISNMYQNVKDTQSELKEQEPHDMKIPPPKPPPPPVNLRTGTSFISPHVDGKPPIYPFAVPAQRVVLSPSSSLRSTRHQSLAQRLRSTSRSVKGYINLGDGPTLIRNRISSLSDDKPASIKEEPIATINSSPKCWKTIYYLLDLYATMPETKTVLHRSSNGADIAEAYKSIKKNDPSAESKSSDDAGEKMEVASSTPIPVHQNLIREEKNRLIIFAVARIHRTKLLATLSGLKLEAEITNLHSSVTCRRKMRPSSSEYSATGQVGRTSIVLLEGVAPNQQTVVQVTVGKSQALYSSVSRPLRDKNSALLTVGAINIDIPQHPVALHGMMTRGTKQLSSTLQELRVTRTSSRISRGTTVEEMDNNVGYQPSPRRQIRSNQGNQSIKSHQSPLNNNPLPQPLVMHFTAIIQSLSITASLLPSLQAKYKMDQLTSNGFTGNKAKFVVDLPRHSLSFSTKVEVTEANLPSGACIELPKVHVSAEYVQDSGRSKDNQNFNADGAVLRVGNYLSAEADIGVFEQSLTTDLLNHLMFVQKVFMKEINEVVQKVYGGEKPVPIWLEDTEETSNSASVKRILFSLVVRIKRIQLTATTPTNCAVCLETGSVEFQISNRFQNVSGSSVQCSETAKIFVKTQLDVNLSLGQLIKNVLFEEADPEFQQFAFFKTRIGIRNAFQGEMVGEGEDKEVILITLRRPLIYIQPVAVDKAVLVWLNYKNAYEYWNEQRSILNSEVLNATQLIYERIAIEKLSSSSSSGILFLQLTVEDMGICVPLNPLPPTTWSLNRSLLPDNDSCAAVVITLESTSISACSAGSLVSKGRFIGLCLRFADDFETSLDDWKPDINNELAGVLMNFCSVSEGTYEVCSRTTTQKSENDNPKWFLNVQWQMEGVDIHLDVNIGKQLSALGHTLTMLTGVQEDEPLTGCYDSDDIDDNTNNSQESLDSSKNIPMDDTLSPLVCDGSVDSKKRSKLLEKEMFEQVKIINDLRSLGASLSTIEQEVKRLHELETLIFRGFRRDMIQKLKRQSVKGKYQLKDKFGLGTKGAMRSKSFILSSPTEEQLPRRQEQHDKPNDLTCGEETKMATLPRISFNEARVVRRQVSLPSANSDLALSVDDKDTVNWLPQQDNKSDEASNTEDELNSTGESSTLLDFSNREQLKNDNVNYSKQQEPNIDFELDVKVFINSGKCVLHTKDQTREDELKMISRMKKDRSCSGGTLEFPGSPSVNRRSHKEKQPSYSRLRLNPSTVTPAQIVELTIFHIPGLDVKVHYESKIIADGNLSPCFTMDSTGMLIRKTNAKKASLFAWITLQSIPEETVVSPHILEFLEQTLEPIPTNLRNPLHFSNSNEASSNFLSGSDDDIFARYITSGQYAYASFPVDVIVYFHMQPSTFRFSCLPVSRVECMLKLPSLDIVFSSKRADEPESKSDNSNLPVAVGGLSVTGVMADFSLYIFHPYGGKKSGSSSKDTQAVWSPLADAERKDSLNVNVEFVKFHLSRSRQLNFETPNVKNTEQRHATIRFSTIVDIGSASFKYDMRRLTEILAFPKAWYRRSIIRRLFLGDLTRAPVFSDVDDESGPDYNEEFNHDCSVDDNRMHGRMKTDKNSKEPISREKIKRQESKKSYSKDMKKRKSDTDDSLKQHKLSSNTAWQTLVLFTVNFKRLNVHMNMGNVMGNVTWLTRDFHSEGRLSIGSTGHKNMFIGLGFGGSSLDAKGGIVGGTIELSKIDTFISIHEDPGTEPDHTIGLKLFALELRLDYMGTAILMSRVSSLNISLRDEWKVITRKSSGDVLNSTKRPAMLFMHGDLSWDQLQIMISKSTAADLIKMYYKLDEFFSQQFKSSKRVFSSLQEGPKSKSSTNTMSGSSSFRKRSMMPKKKVVPTLSEGSTPKHSDSIPPEFAQHHRHWQPCLLQVANLHLSTMKHPLPSWGTVLGGTMDLHGTNISLACFHGINFKSKSWALFSLKEPCISFATEAQEVESREGERLRDVHIVETLTFSLGMTPSMQTYAQQHHSMATICRVSRNVIFPPQFRTIQEWFHYAFLCSDIDAVDRFPSLERERLESIGEGARSRTPKPPETVNHTREVIFALPSLQLHLKTEHLQAASFPSNSIEKPMIDCSFITEFEDHIFVTVDAEAFFFLHDLITSYMKEKDRVAASHGYHRAYSPSPPEGSNKKRDRQDGGGKEHIDSTLAETEERYSKDWRNFQCKTWHLEPTVRLLSWGGKSIEPYGVDYILQKLGFSHARTTIPKWMQRGFMDPLDKVLAVLVSRIITMAKEEPKHDTKKPAR